MIRAVGSKTPTTPPLDDRPQRKRAGRIQAWGLVGGPGDYRSIGPSRGSRPRAHDARSPSRLELNRIEWAKGCHKMRGFVCTRRDRLVALLPASRRLGPGWRFSGSRRWGIWGGRRGIPPPAKGWRICSSGPFGQLLSLRSASKTTTLSLFPLPLPPGALLSTGLFCRRPCEYPGTIALSL